MPTSEYLNTLSFNNSGPFKIKTPLLVTFTQSNNTITCDKTVAEIITALEAGRQVFGFVSKSVGKIMLQATIHFEDSSQRFVKFHFNTGLYVLVVQGESGFDNSTWTTDSWMISESYLGIGNLTGVSISSPSSGQVLTYNGTNWVNGSPSAAGRNITHLRDIEAISSSQSLTFDNAANSAFITVPSTLNINYLSLDITCNNMSENYIWIENKMNADMDVLLSGISYGNNQVYYAYLPDGGISVPKGKTCEIGIVVNQNSSGDYRVIVTFVNYLVGNA